MRTRYPLVQLCEVLTERREPPDLIGLASGEIPIVAKIGFEDGAIRLRAGGDTRTSMILIRPGDLVVSGINAYQGAIAVFGPHNTKPIAATVHYAAYTPDGNRVNVVYLWWLLRSRVFGDTLSKYVPGGIKTELKAKRLLPIPVPLPPLPAQQRIVARINELDAKIQEARGLRRQAMEEAEALLQAASRHAFSPERLGNEVALEIVCSTIIDNLHSNPVYADEGVPCVRSPDVGRGRLYLDGALRTGEMEYRRRTLRGEPQTDDIVLVREGGGTGRAALVEEGQRFSLGQRVMTLRPNKGLVIPKFFLYQLLSPAVYEDQVRPGCMGSASPHLNIGELRKFTLQLPPLSEQRHIVGYLDYLRTKFDSLKRLQQETAAELDAMLPAVLDRAFNGEL